MPDRVAVIAALTAYANKPATSRDLRAEPGELFGHPALTGLMQFTQSVDSRAELNELLAEVSLLIRAADPFRGSVIAINCGTLVEIGGEPGLVFPHLLAELPRHLSLTERTRAQSELAPSALFDTDPDAAKASAGLTYLLLATMTVICRDAAFRQAMRANPEVVAGIAALRNGHREADFVAQVLEYTDGVELIVLDPTEHKGFRVALEAVATCAHLFTLLQAALIDGGHIAGEATDPEVVGIARGEIQHERLLSDHARLHFYAWYALRADGTLDPFPLGALLGVEVSPTDIPLLDGSRVIVLGPPLFGSREWDSNFFASIHPALRSRAEIVEVLPGEQVQAWLDRIKQAWN